MLLLSLAPCLVLLPGSASERRPSYPPASSAPSGPLPQAVMIRPSNSYVSARPKSNPCVTYLCLEIEAIRLGIIIECWSYKSVSAPNAFIIHLRASLTGGSSYCAFLLSGLERAEGGMIRCKTHSKCILSTYHSSSLSSNQ